MSIFELFTAAEMVGFATIAVVSPLAAQDEVVPDQPWEFSVDGGLEVGSYDFGEDPTTFALPYQLVRMDYGVHSRLSFGGLIRVLRFAQGDFESTSLLFAPTLAFHFRRYEPRTGRPYLAAGPVVAQRRDETSQQTSDRTWTGVTLRGGSKIPFASAGFVRLEIGGTHYSGGDIIGEATFLFLNVGLGAELN